ncbi:hypothetical protein MRX96_007039 [Rhipicephalus microplus]
MRGITVGCHDTRDVFISGGTFADAALLVAEPLVALDCWRRLRRATMVNSPSSTISVGGTEFLGTGVEISFHAHVVGSYPRRAMAAICGCGRGEVPTQSAFGATLDRASVAPTRSGQQVDIKCLKIGPPG